MIESEVCSMSKVDVAVTIAPYEGIDEQLKSYLIREKENIDIIELRIDQRESLDFKELEKLLKDLKNIDIKARVLVTYRTAVQGGKGSKNGKDYYEFLQDLIQIEGYNMIDIEWEETQTETLLQLIAQAQAAGLEVVLSQHDFEQTPNLEALKFTYFKMNKLGADILKIAVMPKERQDVLNLLEALATSAESVQSKSVGIAMSHLGLVSRTAQGVFGGAISYGCLGEPQAPGQIHVRKLKELLNLYEINK